MPIPRLSPFTIGLRISIYRQVGRHIENPTIKCNSFSGANLSGTKVISLLKDLVR